jgi:hypothetical protein
MLEEFCQDSAKEMPKHLLCQTRRLKGLYGKTAVSQ